MVQLGECLIWDTATMARRLIHTYERGFSLVELLVVTAVIVVVTSTVLSNHAKFGTTVVLERLSYDVALSLRKAQTYGVSVYRSVGVFAPSYGIHVGSVPATSFILFGDTVAVNNVYDTNESLELQSLLSGYSISQLCATPAVGAESCAFTRIDISFSRPDPDALIRTNGLPALYSRARIVLRSPQADTRSVVVEASGQIMVK
jgi:prepilin-type N-terminal cleavage/methylation domain-containing protein